MSWRKVLENMAHVFITETSKAAIKGIGELGEEIESRRQARKSNQKARQEQEANEYRARNGREQVEQNQRVLQEFLESGERQRREQREQIQKFIDKST